MGATRPFRSSEQPRCARSNLAALGETSLRSEKPRCARRNLAALGETSLRSEPANVAALGVISIFSKSVTSGRTEL
jgi:hypothetical protein